MRKLMLIVAVIELLLNGCASIIKGGGPQAIQLKSTPQGASCDVYDLRTNEQLEKGRVTPVTLMLSPGKAYFQYAKYKVRCSHEDRHQEALIEGSVNGWYIGGNIIFGGLIGYLIVDPITGAMWTLGPETVFLNYDDSSKSILKNKDFETPKEKETAPVIKIYEVGGDPYRK